MAITVRNVTKRFGTFVALDDVSVDVAPGSLTALVGPSGGGKSTLLRIIAGLETPDAGTVEISGEDATALPPQRRGVGFVFQHYAAFKHLTVWRNVAFGLEIQKRPRDEIRRRVQELLELVHIEQFADRLPGQLSGGQRQRMALARALAVEPRVLLLDEPFGALDAQVRKELRDWLRRLHDEVHVTTVFVTHDQEEALDVADHIVVIAGGRVKQAGHPHDVYDRPADDFVMSFLGPVTRIGDRLVRPHDLELVTEPDEGSGGLRGLDDPDGHVGRVGSGAVRATVVRVAKLGFEVRVEIVADGVDLWVQLSRAAADALRLQLGSSVYVRPRQRTPYDELACSSSWELGARSLADPSSELAI